MIYNGTAISVGNPHFVTFVDDVDALDLEKLGPKFEKHKLFPENVNTEFVQVIVKIPLNSASGNAAAAKPGPRHRRDSSLCCYYHVGPCR